MNIWEIFNHELLLDACIGHLIEVELRYSPIKYKISSVCARLSTTGTRSMSEDTGSWRWEASAWTSGEEGNLGNDLQCPATRRAYSQHLTGQKKRWILKIDRCTFCCGSWCWMTCHAPARPQPSWPLVLVINGRISSSNITSSQQPHLKPHHWLFIDIYWSSKTDEGTYFKTTTSLLRLSCLWLECYLAPRPDSQCEARNVRDSLKTVSISLCLERFPQEDQGKLMRVKCLSWPLMKDTIAFNIKLQLFPVGDEALNCLYLTATYGDNLEEKGQVKRESSTTKRSMLPVGRQKR